jgi:plasmid stability protein
MRKYPKTIECNLPADVVERLRFRASEHSTSMSGYIRHLILSDLGLETDDPLQMQWVLAPDQDHPPANAIRGTNSDGKLGWYTASHGSARLE